MRYQRVTGATLGLALMASAAPGWAADEQETRRPRTIPATPPRCRASPAWRNRSRARPAPAAVRGAEPDPDHPQLLLAGKHEGQLHLPHSQGRRRLPAHPPAQRLGPGHGAQGTARATPRAASASASTSQPSTRSPWSAARAASAAAATGPWRTAMARRSANGPSWALPISACAPRTPNSRPVASWSTLRCSAISTTVPCPPASPASP